MIENPIRITTLTLAGVSLTGLALSRFRRGFLVIPALASGLIVWESLPVPSAVTPFLRLFRFRNRAEIERERALKMTKSDVKGAVAGAKAETKAEKKAATPSAVAPAATPKKSRRGKRNLGAPVPESEIEETPPAGEELRPMDEPAPSGPSGNPSRH